MTSADYAVRLRASMDEIVYLLSQVDECFDDAAADLALLRSETDLDEEMQDARGACSLAATFVAMAITGENPSTLAVV